MEHSRKFQDILAQINSQTNFGDLRKIAKIIKKDHELALELWATGKFLPRQLAILIMDKKLLTQDLVDKLYQDIQTHSSDDRIHLTDWFFANQLTKGKDTINMIESWRDSPSALQRRTYWYYQARKRWMGQDQSDSTLELLSAIENKISSEEPEVQWAMNFTAGWIGVYEKENRDRCITLGENTGLYKGKMVSKGCTPEYLPEFIAIESKKRKL